MHLVFDLSLSVAKPWLQEPSGIDRVEFAHAMHWRSLPTSDVTFVMRNAWHQFAVIPDGFARTWIDVVEHRLNPGQRNDALDLRLRSGLLMSAQAFGLGRRELMRRLDARGDSVFLTVSCASLHLPGALHQLRLAGCRIVPLVHDLIPITHPQYSIDIQQPRLHRLRMQAIAKYADEGLIVSQSALEALHHHGLENGLVIPPMVIAPPGLGIRSVPNRGTLTEPPYFLMLGSLEPRKNHLLLLQIWQEMCRRPKPPKLVIVGKMPARGTLATHMLDTVDFRGSVEYRGRVSDAEVGELLRHAAALVFPSIIEGYGIPISEALAAGTPVLASDIAAFREHGRNVPEYIHPLDGPAWHAMIEAYAMPDSPRRQAQIERMSDWTANTWESHFNAVTETLLRVAASPIRRQSIADS